MNKKPFNPSDWQSPARSLCSKSEVRSMSSGEAMYRSDRSEVESLTHLIETSATDIAPTYHQWRDLGFALSNELGESGRTYYHRLSRFHPTYSQKETEHQYTACLNAKGHGITIKTLFHLAKESGVVIERSRNVVISAPLNNQKHNWTLSVAEVPPKTSQNKSEVIEVFEDIEVLDEAVEKPLPTIPVIVYKHLPIFLQKITSKSISNEDRDLLLLGSLVAISSCLPNIYGNYAERNVYPNLFLFITAIASAGKGRLTLCRKLVEPIHKSLREQSKNENEIYQRDLTEYSASKNKADMDRPKEPPMRMLIIPANNSSTGLFQILNDNKGIGLIFETEGDTLAQTFKSEHGNYSDGFRKAFHHETISYNRRKDREYVELETPRLSALLSGTPKQVSTLIPNAENGLFSRFIFYYMNILPVWKDVFTGDGNQTLDDYFRHLGSQFFTFYNKLYYQTHQTRFSLTTEQQQIFNAYFEQSQTQYLYLFGIDYLATVRRLGLITFRISMILTALRKMDNEDFGTNLICNDTDFYIALEIVKILMQHAAHIFSNLPANAEPTKRLNNKKLLLEQLPEEFTWQEAKTIADNLNIAEKTAERYIKKFAESGILYRFTHGNYRKN